MVRLNDISINRKLYLAAGVVAVTLIAGGLTGYFSLQSAVSDYEQALASGGLSAELARREVEHLRWVERAGAFRGDSTIGALAVELDPTRCELGRWLAGEDRVAAERVVAGLAPVLERVDAAHGHLHAAGKAIDATLRAGEGRTEAEVHYRTALVPAAEALLGEIEDAGARLERHVEATLAGAAGARRASMLILLVGTFAGVVGVSAFGIVFARSISRPLNQVTALVDELSRGHLGRRLELERGDELGQLARDMDGLADHLRANVAGVMDRLARGDTGMEIADRDLTARMERDYEGRYADIKASLNRAVQNLDETLQEVEAAAEQVAAASDQIAGGSETLAQGATEQASSLEEVSSSLRELGSIARRNAEYTDEGRRISEEARAATRQGLDSMARLSEAMERIKESSDATSRIVKTIDEIAFQTNLLALNASVEAARAGEAGKGFAVVAEEVRGLALRSADAARNTAALIEESVESSGEGMASQTEVQARLEELADGVGRVREVVAEIAAASDQQKGGVDQITDAVEEMGGVTQSTAASAEESASGAEELSSQAQRMRDMVAEFTLSVVGRPPSTRSSQGLPVTGLPAPVWTEADDEMDEDLMAVTGS